METQRVAGVNLEPSVALVLIPAIVLDADTHEPVFVEVEQHTRQVELAVTFECLLYEEVGGLLVYFSVFPWFGVHLAPVHNGAVRQSIRIIEVKREPFFKEDRNVAPIKFPVVSPQRIATIILRTEFEPREEHFLVRACQRPAYTHPIAVTSGSIIRYR